MVNIRNKGQNGEREIATLLNGILILTMRELGYDEKDVVKAAASVQRNQNQSAVGGGDLINTFGLSVEVKRQETLNVEAWWRQCVTSAQRNNEWPVLLYRQNNKAWHCRTFLYAMLPDSSQIPVVADLSYIYFQQWYRAWIKVKLHEGHEVRT